MVKDKTKVEEVDSISMEDIKWYDFTGNIAIVAISVVMAFIVVALVIRGLVG